SNRIPLNIHPKRIGSHLGNASKNSTSLRRKGQSVTDHLIGSIRPAVVLWWQSMLQSMLQSLAQDG
ncbi:hypothetical protein N8446_08650, partial [Planktomarina temperata]|nr:hypothetical protein [Planktomarina temperata]